MLKQNLHQCTEVEAIYVIKLKSWVHNSSDLYFLTVQRYFHQHFARCNICIHLSKLQILGAYLMRDQAQRAWVFVI